MTEFIFMLTKNDLTIPNAVEVFEEVKASRVRFLGFKDVGLPIDRLSVLAASLKREKKTSFLEVVSESEEAALRSARVAKDLGIDYLIGGTYVEKTLPLVRGSGIKYFPYIGKVIGHPCLLRGTIEQIAEDAKRVEKLGVHGINLLAYRYDGDVDLLISSVLRAVNVPVISAGSIDSLERVRKMVELKLWAFTIGGAVFDRRFVPGGTISSQIDAVLNCLQ